MPYVAFSRKSGKPIREYGEEDDWDVASYTKEAPPKKQKDILDPVQATRERLRKEFWLVCMVPDSSSS